MKIRWISDHLSFPLAWVCLHWEGEGEGKSESEREFYVYVFVKDKEYKSEEID